MINPNDSYRKIACNKSMSLKIRSIAHQFINLELHFGPQATHMHTIKHLAHCQRCFPHKDCDCSDCKRPARTCTCSCHHPNAPLNNPHHIFFCPTLDDFWTYILAFAEHCSIVFPKQNHLIKWCIISSDLGDHSNQPQKWLWYKIYSCYAPIVKLTHYFPDPPGAMLKKFKNSFTHSLKVAHSTLLKTIDRINAKIIDEDDKTSLISKEIKEFCKTWSHPNICILNDDYTIDIQPWPNLEEDPWAKYTYSSYKTLIEAYSLESHPYRTKNHP